MYANLILGKLSKSTSGLYTYKIPKAHEFKLKVGDRVIVNFGNSNRYIDGLVYSISKSCNLEYTKDIIDVLPEKYSFTATQFNLMEMIVKRYATTYSYSFMAVLPVVQAVNIREQFMINSEELSYLATVGQTVEKSQVSKMLSPAQIKAYTKDGKLLNHFKYGIRTNSKFTQMVYCNFDDLNATLEGIRKQAKKQIRILEHIFDTKSQELNELISATASTRADLKLLEGKNLIRIEKKLSKPTKTKYELAAKNIMNLPLTDEQAYVFNEYMLRKSKGIPFRALVQGVTGSGKTRLYMEMAKLVILAGKQVLILLPEISLTPQLIGVFRENISDKIAVIHNKITDTQKSTDFEHIKNGDIDVVIGARSAIFAPFSNLGLIIIDEVHENSYSSELTPRYDIRELAFDLSLKLNIDLVYGSATPPLQILNLAYNNHIEKFDLKNRIGHSLLPVVEVIDMKSSFSHDRELLISNKLIDEMRVRFDRKEQVILFYNRRGYASFLQCMHCGHVLKCINCDITLKVHKKGRQLNCHYCGYSRQLPTHCEHCECMYDKADLVGVGIEKYMDFFQRKFPEIGFCQVDSETVNTPEKLVEKLNQFASGEIDCMIGTQILAKGLDFPNVTLIGILDSDQLINMSDYMANERAFQLMSQVAGRAGRHEKSGHVIIQTFNPELDIFKYLKAHDFDGFIADEYKIRNELDYPPLSKMYMIGISSESEDIAKNDARKVYQAIDSIFHKLKIETRIFRPNTSYYTKIKNRYMYHIILKGSKSEYFKIVNILYQVISVDKFKLLDLNSHTFLEFNPIFL